MSWFRLDDQGAFHVKVLDAGNEAYGAWCRAGQWSSAQLTEGFIPKKIALMVARPRIWQRLCDAKLCDLRDDGWQIHDFLDWNPSAAEVRGKRAVRADAGRRGGLRSAERRASNGQAIASANAEGVASASREAKSNPVPSRPVPSRSQEICDRELTRERPSETRKIARATKPAKEPETLIPSDFAVTPELEAICRRENLANPHDALRDFRDWAEEKQVRKARWDATFRRWMRSKITAERYRPWNETDPVRVPVERRTPPTPEQLECRRRSDEIVRAALAEMDARAASTNGKGH